MLRNRIYFAVKPYLPRRLRGFLRSRLTRSQLVHSLADWPIDEAAGRTPQGWKGWPGGKRFAVVLTHDVESQIGFDQTLGLAQVEERLGFRSSFNFVPEGPYTVRDDIRRQLKERGFEVGVHDLRHDGKLYQSRESFRRHARRINHYLQDWQVTGFRSALMLHQLDWLHDLNLEYDASTFDTDPFEPQPDGASTIFPFWVPRPGHPGDDRANPRPGYVELPYTLPQDSTLFLFLGHRDPSLWKRKVDWIAQQGGMVLLNLHPDYPAFAPDQEGPRTYPIRLYQELLSYLQEKYPGDYWQALPLEVARYIRATYPEGGPRRPRHACMLSYSFFERDNRVQRYAKALAARGDSVDVLSLAAASDASSSPNGPATACPGGVRPSWTPFAPGIRVFHVQTRARDEKKVTDYAFRMLAFLARSFVLINRLHRLRQFDVIHVHNVPDFLIFAAWLAKRRGSRLILDLHDLLPEFYAAKFHCTPESVLFRIMRWVERISCRFADHVIVSNHLWRDKVAARTGLGDRCTAMVNHVDTEPYRAVAEARQRLPERNGHSIAAFPGGFYRHQGLHVAIEALVHVRQRFPHAELHLLGDGPERERLQDRVRELGLDDAVRILPPVPMAEVPQFLANATLGIVPKLADGFGNEAYSTKIMEFMAAGLPVIASRTRIDEFYFGKGEVHFFDSGNPNDAAKAWIEVLEDAPLRKTLINSGALYVDQHGWQRHTKHYLGIVDSLAAH